MTAHQSRWVRTVGGRWLRADTITSIRIEENSDGTRQRVKACTQPPNFGGDLSVADCAGPTAARAAARTLVMDLATGTSATIDLTVQDG